MKWWLIFGVRVQGGAMLSIHETGPFESEANCEAAMRRVQEAFKAVYLDFFACCIQR